MPLAPSPRIRSEAAWRELPSKRVKPPIDMTIFAGPASTSLARAVAAQLGQSLGTCTVQRFPDSELYVELHDSVRGHDVYLLQATSPPVDLHLLELLFLADACRRAGAARLTAVMPYCGYRLVPSRYRGVKARRGDPTRSSVDSF
jgi:phosphoribosylpyrophosphate synthetase